MDIYSSVNKVLEGNGVIKFGNFTLSSGKSSNYYVDMKKVITIPKVLKLISHNIANVMKTEGISPDYIGCIELGGVPIGTAVSLDTNIDLIIVRKNKKNYGIEDMFIGDFKKSKVVLLVDDVATTGGSLLRSVQAMRDEGLIVNTVITVVDREEGAADNLSKIGVVLISLVKASDLLKNTKYSNSKHMIRK